jgi:hypothetical protein
MPLIFQSKAPSAFFAIFMVIQISQSIERTRLKENVSQENYINSKHNDNKSSVPDNSNIAGNIIYNAEVDSLKPISIHLDTIWKNDGKMRILLDTFFNQLKRNAKISNTLNKKIKENIRILDSFVAKRTDTLIFQYKENNCLLFAAVSKSKQLLYLYINGTLKDSFKVSTGKKDFLTPDLNLRPEGPVYTKYSSRKYPGGDYNGLGNMPYAVFLSDGVAIHGTTPGNFSKLGTVASHGCIRLHPDNGKIFNELVKMFGIKNTWVIVKDSLD